MCNAVILAKKNTRFLKIWLEEYRNFRSKGFDEYWDELSVVRPYELSCKHPDLIHAEKERSFFPVSCTQPEQLWTNSRLSLKHSYCVHLFETLWWKILAKITPDFIVESDCCFAKTIRSLFAKEIPEIIK